MSSKKAKRESRKRAAAESALALAKAGAGLVVPAAPLVLDLLAKLGSGFWRERKESRLSKFHREFLAGLPDDEQSALVARIKSDADAKEEWARIAEQVWDDDEEEKTGVYARLLRFLLSKVPDARERRHLVRSVRALAASDIDLLKTALRIGGPWPEPATTTDTAGFVHLAPPSADREAHHREQARFLEEGDALTLSGIQRLEHSGFIKRITGRWGGDGVDVTPLGLQLLRAVESV